MPRVELKGIHRVSKKLAGGKVREYHYAYRRGPQFWSSESDFKVGGADYLEAFLEASKPHLLRGHPPIPPIDPFQRFVRAHAEGLRQVPQGL